MSGILALTGNAALPDQQVVNVGFATQGFGDDYYGFNISPLGMGIITDGTFNPAGGAVINTLMWSITFGEVTFSIDGINANSGWSNMNLNATDFARASATFSGAGPTTWQWLSASNPFTDIGTDTTVVFT